MACDALARYELELLHQVQEGHNMDFKVPPKVRTSVGVAASEAQFPRTIGSSLGPTLVDEPCTGGDKSCRQLGVCEQVASLQ